MPVEPVDEEIDQVEVRVAQLFALVSESLAGATEALLSNDVSDRVDVSSKGTRRSMI